MNPGLGAPKARRLPVQDPSPPLRGGPAPASIEGGPIDGVLRRLRSPNITPGYWRDKDEPRGIVREGFYRMGDAIAPVDPDDPSVAGGFVFCGRLHDDFKLSTGTWVRVGTVRARLLAELGDIALDVVVAGHGRERIAVLIFPNLPACRTLAVSTSPASLAADAGVRSAFERLARYTSCPGQFDLHLSRPAPPHTTVRKRWKSRTKVRSINARCSRAAGGRAAVGSTAGDVLL